MPADLLSETAPDAEDFVVQWLLPLYPAATERTTGDALPFCVVARISGPDDPDEGLDQPVVQVDTFGVGAAAASLAAKDVHRRMLYLAKHSADVTMSDSSLANADWVETLLKPFRMPYQDDQIVRYVARYQLGLSYVTVA